MRTKFPSTLLIFRQKPSPIKFVDIFSVTRGRLCSYHTIYEDFKISPPFDVSYTSFPKDTTLSPPLQLVTRRFFLVSAKRHSHLGLLRKLHPLLPFAVSKCYLKGEKCQFISIPCTSTNATTECLKIIYTTESRVFYTSTLCSRIMWRGIYENTKYKRREL